MMTTNIQTASDKVTPGFAQMSFKVMQRIAREDGGYRHLAAYIVLSGGVNNRNGVRYCTHGAHSVDKRTAMGNRAAQNALDWLRALGVIDRPTEHDPQHVGNRPSRSQAVRWILNDSDSLDVALSRQFIDGTASRSGESTFLRILSEVSGNGMTVTRGQAIMDVLLVYAALMRAQDFANCAGVDPDVWHQPFEPDHDSETQHICDVPNSSAVMVTVKQVDNHFSTNRFIQSVLGGDPSDGAAWEVITERFWLAIGTLRDFRLIYRVLVLWHGDPLDPAQRSKAEPIATHYISDAWAREIDPHLQYEVNSAAWRLEIRDAASDFSGFFTGDPIPFIGTGSFRYIVSAKSVNHTHLVGQFRVRFWAANKTNVTGREVEKTRTNKFLESIKNLGRGA